MFLRLSTFLLTLSKPSVGTTILRFDKRSLKDANLLDVLSMLMDTFSADADTSSSCVVSSWAKPSLTLSASCAIAAVSSTTFCVRSTTGSIAVLPFWDMLSSASPTFVMVLMFVPFKRDKPSPNLLTESARVSIFDASILLMADTRLFIDLTRASTLSFALVVLAVI